MGIPDEVPNLAMSAHRAPSWKAIAHCLLKNDLQLLGLGYQPIPGERFNFLRTKDIETDQMELF